MRPALRSQTPLLALAAVGALLLLSACAAGDPRYTAEAPAGFWTGLWHGMISCVALIIGLFSDRVEVYERFNSGGWYDFGFLFGILMLWGGGSHGGRHAWPKKKSPEQLQREQEWEEIGKKVELKLRRKIREWAEAEPDEDWEVVGDKAEAKLRRKLREWAEDEPTEEHPMLGGSGDGGSGER